jgi:hypothetical protein
MRGLRPQSDHTPKEKIMNLIRSCFLLLAVLLPTTWTIARADEMKDGDKGGDMKKDGMKKKKSKGDMGDKDKKGDMDKK